MLERLRLLLDRPLDPRVARAVLALAAVALIGYATLVAIAGVGAGGSDPAAPLRRRPGPDTPRDIRSPERTRPRQDPQDDPASAAGARSRRELHVHAALQQVPYLHGSFSVLLVGARGGRAVLRVSAPTLRLARSGWRRFLRRFSDSGTAYIPHFARTPIRAYGPAADQPDGWADGQRDGSISSQSAEFRHPNRDCGDAGLPTSPGIHEVIS